MIPKTLLGLECSPPESFPVWCLLGSIQLVSETGAVRFLTFHLPSLSDPVQASVSICPWSALLRLRISKCSKIFRSSIRHNGACTRACSIIANRRITRSMSASVTPGMSLRSGGISVPKSRKVTTKTKKLKGPMYRGPGYSSKVVKAKGKRKGEKECSVCTETKAL